MRTRNPFNAYPVKSANAADEGPRKYNARTASEMLEPRQFVRAEGDRRVICDADGNAEMVLDLHAMGAYQ